MKRKKPRKDTTMDNKDKEGHSNSKSKQKLWWIGWRQWFGWKEWMCSKWRDKVNITREVERTTSRQPNKTGNQGENGRTRLTITDSFGTYRRMCGFGGGECRSVIHTLRGNCNFVPPDREWGPGENRKKKNRTKAYRQGAKRQERNGWRRPAWVSPDEEDIFVKKKKI